MGWCSGTHLFDQVITILLGRPQTDTEMKDAIRRIILAFENEDWDCQYDSDYINADSLVRKVYEQMEQEKNNE